jgi:hypothetical protein
MSRIRVIYMQTFVAVLQNYFMNGPIMKALNASNKASQQPTNVIRVPYIVTNNVTRRLQPNQPSKLPLQYQVILLNN